MSARMRRLTLYERATGLAWALWRYALAGTPEGREDWLDIAHGYWSGSSRAV